MAFFIPVLKLLLVGVQKAVQVLQHRKISLFLRAQKRGINVSTCHINLQSDGFNKHIW